MSLSFKGSALKTSLLLLCANITGATAIAQYDVVPPTDPFPIERYMEYPLINGRSPSAPDMAPDGHAIVFGWNHTGDRKLDLYWMSYPSGKTYKIVSADAIQDLPRQDDSRTKEQIQEQKTDDGGIGSAQWAPDSKTLLFSYKGRWWLVNEDGKELRAIVDGGSGLSRPEFSHDGKYLAFIQGTNIVRYDLGSHDMKQITFLSKPQTAISAYSWSPNDKKFVVTWDNTSKNGTAVMMDFTSDRAKVVNIDRDWNGSLSVDEKIGIVDASGGLIKFVDKLPQYLWVKNLEWSPDSSKIAIGWISGDFQSYEIDTIDPGTQALSKLYEEKAPKNFIPDWRPLVWTRNGSAIDFGTDIQDNKFIFRSIFSLDVASKAVKPLYVKNYDVGALARPKDSDDLILVTGTPSPLQTQIQILSPDGASKTYSVLENGNATPKLFDEAGLPIFDDSGKNIATIASSRIQNPELYGVLPRPQKLTDSTTAMYKKVKWADVKEVTFPGPDGATIHALMITKPGMDLSKPHPAIVSNIYGDSGKNAWGGFVDNYMAMNLNMVVLCVDFSASWGYGGDFDSRYANKMGIIDADEAEDANKYLRTLSFVNPDRIGIWGWSYGGYLTLMTLLTKPGIYHCGVAVAPVTDWSTYNEWYTRRRLGLYKDNKAIYEKTSPISHASGLKDDLLIIHGILDNNVLFQNTAYFVEKLIEAGKYVDVMIYPRDDHSIGHDKSRPNVFGRITRYLQDKLDN